MFEVSYKSKHVTTILPSNCIPGSYSLKNEGSSLYKYVNPNVYSSFGHNNQKNGNNSDVLQWVNM